ncbi:MAG: hypothetical protein JXA37_10435 [Chloroflexia bacterium]|nr:hypothetical protein [Chloroflexia bacterium]
MPPRIKATIDRLLRPGSAALWAGGLFLLLFAALAVQPIPPADFWWHLKVGEIVLDEGCIPRQDLFSYTVPGEPFLYQSWLAGLCFALLYRLGGAALAVVLNAALLTAAYALLWRLAHQVSGSHYAATLAALAALLVSAGNWAPRPQSFSILLFALFLWLLRQIQQGRPALLWLLPPLLALWANLHGAFVLGLALLGGALLGEVIRSLRPGWPQPGLSRPAQVGLLATTLAAAAATLLNPAGWRIWDYVRTIQQNAVIREAIAEWQPPSTDNSVGIIFYLSLLGLFFLLLYRRCRPLPSEALWLAGTTWLALGGVRSIIWYSFVLGLLLARALAGLPWPAAPEPGRRQGLLNLALLSALALLALLATPYFKGALPLPCTLRGTLSADTPVQAADFIQQNLSGRLFHRMEHGGYLLWRFYPQRRIFIDSRIELYPSFIWQDYVALSAGAPEAAALLDNYNVEILLLDRSTQQGLLERLDGSPDWQIRYENPAEGSVVLTRN